MKKVYKKVKINFLLSSFIFLGLFILLNFLLYIVNVRFRLWFDILCISLFCIGFIIGIIQFFKKDFKTRKIYLLYLAIISAFIIILLVIFAPFIIFIGAFSYSPEHTTKLDGKKYVAVVNSFLHVNVNYYDYYGPILMGTKVKVYGDFGKGGYDPFVSKNTSDYVNYTYYDKSGKPTKKSTIYFIKDKNGNVVDTTISEEEYNKNKEFNDNEKYLLPEDEEILYKKKFDEHILIFGKVDVVLGQNMLVNVVESVDNGQNFYVVSDDVIKVSNEAKYIFLTEDLGFVISTGSVDLKNNAYSLYVTQDGGKTFNDTTFNYTNDNVQYMDIDSLPYFENNELKIKCSVYDFKADGSGYETVDLIFKSDDNGLSWNLIK